MSTNAGRESESLFKGTKRERFRRTVASESLLVKANVNDSTEERKRGGQRQDDKGILGAVVYKHLVKQTITSDRHDHRSYHGFVSARSCMPWPC